MITRVSPSQIGLHPALAGVPLMTALAERLAQSPKAEVRAEGADLATEWRAFSENVKENGVLEPIKVTLFRGNAEVQYLACDGRHRLCAAKVHHLASVPVEVVTEKQARKIIEATVIARRNWTQGMKAYFAVIMHPEIVHHAAQREKAGQPSALNAEGLAAQYGLGLRTLEQAMQLYRTFHAAPGADEAAKIEAEALREQYEPSLWAGHGLGGVIAGIEGGRSTKGAKKIIGFQGLTAPFGTISRFSKQFTKWDDAERQKARTLTERWLANEVHPEFRLMLAEAITSITDEE
jgi:hypothetical protein